MANETLQNVFAACDKEPNMVPFDILLFKKEASTKFYNICMAIALFAFLIIFMMPLAFPHDSMHITHVDYSTDTDISVIDHTVSADTLRLVLDDSIDYSNTFMEDANGKVFKPQSYDPASHTIIFSYHQDEVNIFIFDDSGKQLHLLITPEER